MKNSLRRSAQGQPCKIDGCDKHAVQRGWCAKHYARWYRTGSATTEPYSCRKAGAEERFFESCIPVPESGCWIWLKSVSNQTGYGKAHHDGREISAHRLAFKLFVGEIPEGLQVLHSCDTRCCVNPDHLRAGTQKENAEDAVTRMRVGRLRTEEVLAIRADPRSTRDIGRSYGISSGHVSSIKRGKSWQEIR